MAAPTHTIRQTPVGIKLDDGFSTRVAFARDPDVSFWEKTVQPPGLDAGDAIETSTMHNVRWRTMAARSLITMTDGSITAAYDPSVITQIVELLGQEGMITIHFPDGTQESFYGFLKSFEPQEHSEGEQPEANITIVCTNYDPVNRVEAGPAVAAVSGT